MGILNKLQSEGSTLSAFNGLTPSGTATELGNSKVHHTYSVNGNPALSNLPSPSILDRDGITPPKYIDNLPE